MLTIAELSVNSAKKYEIIANDINRADSKIEECEIDLWFLVINVAITPKNNPIKTERTTSFKKSTGPSIKLSLYYILSPFISIILDITWNNIMATASFAKPSPRIIENNFGY